MRSSTGRWVSGDDFFDRELELKALEGRIRDFNHVLLTGQRRMGKTSITRELGRRVEARGWGFIPADVQGATCPEDVIAGIAEKAHPIRSALVDDAPGRVSDALEVLIHDGYLEAGDDGHRFLSRLLKDWWSARFRDHHTPLLKRPSARPRWFR